MKLSYNWLKEHLDIDVSIETLVDLIISKIGEIEEHYLLTCGTDLTIGHVIECVNHPNSDHLHVCKVDIGREVKQIVCGAPNVALGQKVIVANVGCKFKDFEIKEAKIRGVESHGMICSLSEIGIPEKMQSAEDREGICILGNDAMIGSDPLAYLELNDYVIDLDVTPNRGDLMSIYGAAYDIGATLGSKPRFKEVKVEETTERNPVETISLTEKCKTYYMRYIRNVKIGESPNWLKARLIASGIRPINNVVDITNYILIKYGQPLHAFDGELLGNKVVVREAFEKEEIVTLDGIKRELIAGDILITDGNKPVCLGGVMGGADTEVNAKTNCIALEAAIFDPVSIRATSRRMDLRSESSIRFERKIDQKRVERALNEAAFLIGNLAGGEILKGISKVETDLNNEIAISITTEEVQNTLGISISTNELAEIFDKYCFTYTNKGSKFTVNTPSHRVDYDSNKQNLLEDVARLYGYYNIPFTQPKLHVLGGMSRYQSLIREIKRALTGLGMQETINYTLTSEEANQVFEHENGEAHSLLHPISEERKETRTNLLSSLLEVLKYNKARSISDLLLFEISNVYGKEKQGEYLAGVLTGVYQHSLWQGEKKAIDFFLVKGLLEAMFDKLGVNIKYAATTKKNLHPKRSANMILGDEIIGYLGALHPNSSKDIGLKDVYVFEINLSFLNHLSKQLGDMNVSKFPSIRRDLALVLPQHITVGEMLDVIKQTGKKLLIECNVFDVYQLEKDRSVAVSLVFNDFGKTLETQEVNELVNRILKALQYKLNITLRT